MKLRIARKMDPGGYENPKRQRKSQRDKRKWWTIYSHPQLLAAERKLLRQWVKYRTKEWDPVRKDFLLGVTPDFLAANRITSRRLRVTQVRHNRRVFEVPRQ